MALPGSQQLWPPVTVNRIVQTTLYRLAKHPFIYNPPVWDADGKPIKIGKFRNFDGPEVKFPGLTLSIFPYHYSNSDESSALTVDTKNAGLVFKPYTMGGGYGDVTAMDHVTCNLVLKLHMFGYRMESSDDSNLIMEQNTQFEFNYIEWLLQQYAELVASALRSSQMRKLPGFVDNTCELLANSFVKNINWPTSTWSEKGNLVLHSASLLWQTEYYVVREWRKPPTYVPVAVSDGNLDIGTIPGSGLLPESIYYDTIRRLYLKEDGAVVLREDLNDPGTGLPYTTLDSDLILLIDESPTGTFDFSVYYKRDADPGPERS